MNRLSFVTAVFGTLLVLTGLAGAVDLSKGFGIIDFGPRSHWFAYKRLLDMGNEKFYMLADLTGNYRLGFTTLALLAGLGSVFFLLAKRPARPLRRAA